MGIAVGLFSILGTFAGASGQLILAVLFVLILTPLSLLAGDASIRFTVVTGTACCMLCAVLATLQTPDKAEIADAPLAGAIRVEIVSDPRVSGRGSSAEVMILNGPTRNTSTIAFMPASFDPVRGAVVELQGEFPDATRRIYFADRARTVRDPGFIESHRSDVRKYLVDQVQAVTPGSPGTLTVGLLTGDDSALTSDERDNLRRSGLSHITAVSGWNVTVVVGTVALVFRAAGLQGRFWTLVQIAGIILYVWLVGLQPPIIRAAIMGSIALVATWFGRPAHALTLLSLTAAAMAVLDPSILWSVSFQLSFLAMVGLSVTMMILRESHGLKQVTLTAILTPVFAAIATAPLIAAHFGMISLITVPANIVVAPLVSPMALMGFLGAMFASMYAPLGVPPGSVAWLFGRFILEVAGSVNWMPSASMSFRPPEPGSVIGMYLIFALAASPWIPELRYLIRRSVESMGAWERNTLLAAGSYLAVLLTGGLIIMMV